MEKPSHLVARGTYNIGTACQGRSSNSIVDLPLPSYMTTESINAAAVTPYESALHPRFCPCSTPPEAPGRRIATTLLSELKNLSLIINIDVDSPDQAI
jgi:hypothetical protein